MAGPTTEVLNENLKELRADAQDIRAEVEVVKAGLYRLGDDNLDERGCGNLVGFVAHE